MAGRPGRRPAPPLAAKAARGLHCLALLAALLLPGGAALAKPAPDGFAELAAKLLPAVVNISTTQIIKSDKPGGRPGPDIPQFPPGSPFEEVFKEFFDRNQPPGNQQALPRRGTPLGTGGLVDPPWVVGTHHHDID